MMEFKRQIVLPQIGLFLMFYFQLCSSDETLFYRVEDKPFPMKLVIHNRSVRCNQEDHDLGSFPAYTWTCKNMSDMHKIDQLKILHVTLFLQAPTIVPVTLHTGSNSPLLFLKEEIKVDGLRMAYGYNPSITKDNKCQETKGRDELAEVCRRMMHTFGTSYTLWAAFVTNATCNFINEKRVFLNMTGPNIYKWEDMKPGYGWIDTLRCTALQ